ncbi:phosphatase PAP2 family protein [Lederbergia citrea]|uniref:Phosphatase PAP2 family protein n=1 Tax=Lederbergia citrea TaxID=2833581 RepID=A0A942USF9_9BACI|nr:phosphatase PAP2 family protein [Lederbergia citrea]MBS4176669.1 phosphatase PAP2 family protein [Lederbergia citrea]MBS4222099.1 phosphatase PAP2 family protein [Lederbergia citrea]
MNTQQKANDFPLISIVIALVGTGIFLFLAATLNSSALERFDLSIIKPVQAMISPSLTTFFLFITFFGSVKGVALMTIVFFSIVFFTRNRLLALYLVISVAIGAGVFNRLLKAIFKRERPDILQLVKEHGFSFPSGHAMGSVIFFGGVIFVLYKMYGWNRTALTGSIIASVLIILIGLSRIYLGVHYPSDVIAGYAAGTLWIGIGSIIFGLVEKKRGKR